jgi:hypothetical protein
VGVSVEVGGGDDSIADFTLPEPAAVLEAMKQIHAVLHAVQPSGLRSRGRPRIGRP